MRLIWLTTVFDDSAVSTILLTILPHFSKQIDITVVSMEKSDITNMSRALMMLREKNIMYRELDCKKTQLWKMKRRLEHTIKEVKPDIVHAQLGRAYIALLLAKKQLKKDVRYKKIATFHNDAEFFNILTYKFLKCLFKRFSAVSAVSESCLQNIQRHFDVEKNIPGSAIYNPIHIADEISQSIQPVTQAVKKPVKQSNADCIKLFSAGRLIEGKGLDLIMNAFPLMKEEAIRRGKEIQLFIAGDGPLKSYLERYIEAGEYAQEISLLGFRNDIASLNVHADVVLFPSQTEGFGLVPCEALLTGTPVAMQNLPVLEELFADDYWFVDCRSPKKFSEKVFKLYDNEDGENQQHIETAQNRIKKLFSPKKIAKDYEDWYSQVLE